MRSQVYTRGPTTPRMNITPLIDVVFLLIIFFMLVSNIVAAESERMLVPDLVEPQTRTLGQAERLVVNVLPEGFGQARLDAPLLHPGRAVGVKVGSLRRFGMDELDKVTEAVQRAHASAKGGELEVLVRADAALHYREVRPVLEAVTAAGVQTVHLVAYLPGEGPGRGGP